MGSHHRQQALGRPGGYNGEVGDGMDAPVVVFVLPDARTVGYELRRGGGPYLSLVRAAAHLAADRAAAEPASDLERDQASW